MFFLVYKKSYLRFKKNDPRNCIAKCAEYNGKYSTKS